MASVSVSLQYTSALITHNEYLSAKVISKERAGNGLFLICVMVSSVLNNIN
jgi:hypothetical protein